MPPDRFDGSHMHGGGPFWLGMLFTGVSLLLWLAIPMLLAWAALRWGRRSANPLFAAASQEGIEPSAIELLRRRYVMGEIDYVTLEVMTERVLTSEAHEHASNQVRLVSGGGEITYL